MLKGLSVLCRQDSAWRRCRYLLRPWLPVIANKHAFVQAETGAWRALAASTDFPVGE